MDSQPIRTCIVILTTTNDSSYPEEASNFSWEISTCENYYHRSNLPSMFKGRKEQQQQKMLKKKKKEQCEDSMEAASELALKYRNDSERQWEEETPRLWDPHGSILETRKEVPSLPRGRLVTAGGGDSSITNNTKGDTPCANHYRKWLMSLPHLTFTVTQLSRRFIHC